MGAADDGPGVSVEIRPARPEDRAAVLRIWDEQFGAAGDRAVAWLDRALPGDDAAAFVAADGAVRGFLVAATADPGYASGYVRGVLSPGELPEETAVLHMLCVDDGWQGRGIGTCLARECLAWARRRAGLVVAVSWLRDGAADSAPLFEGLGFERLATVEGYYRGDREDCPDCRGECTCRAAVYGRTPDGGT